MKRIRKTEIITILSLAFPIIIENILQTLLGTTDTYFAGKLTDNAIAGISVTNIIMNIFISFFTAISIGTTAVVSRNYGKKGLFKNKSCNRPVYYCWNSTRVNCRCNLSDFS